MSRDIRYAWRAIRKTPVFTASVVLTLALGIGGTTAVFSVVQGTMLQPLPYSAPYRLVDIVDSSSVNPNLARTFSTYGDFEEYSKHKSIFDGVAFATWATGGSTLTGHGPAREILSIQVSQNFFSTLGVVARLGRTFAPEDMGRGCSVVLSGQFWRATLAADSAIVGRVLQLNNRACSVLGVMPDAFEFYPGKTQLWMLLTPDDQRPRDRLIGISIARMKAGVTTVQVQKELEAAHKQLSQGEWHREFNPVVSDLRDDFLSLAGRNFRTTLIALLAAVSLVLLIACVNVANLLLGRVSVRSREFAVRAALGAGRTRLIAQLLTEGLFFAALGGLGGLLIAFGFVRYFLFVNPIELPVGSRISINEPVLIFTTLLIAATAVLFSIAPAWHSTRQDVISGMSMAGRGSVDGAGRRLSQLLITAEISLSLFLFGGANLLVRSVLNMSAAPLGFDPERVTTEAVNIPEKSYRAMPDKLEFYKRLERRLGSIPGGGISALATTMPPYSAGNYELQLEGSQRTGIQDTGENAVSAGYFNLFRIDLRRGRLLDRRDTANSAEVAVINEALARRHFRGVDPIGKRIRSIGFTEGPWVTIVGVVATEKHPEFLREMAWRDQPALYRPIQQAPADHFSIALRPASEGIDAGREIERALSSIDQEISFGEEVAVRSLIATYLNYPRFRGLVVSQFAGVALLLATIGLHGLLSQYVAQRTRELGLRMALGAGVRDVVYLICKQAGTPVAAGLGIGILLIGLASRYLTSLFFGVEPLDLPMCATLLVALATVAVAATARPLRRAIAVDPGVALRDE